MKMDFRKHISQLTASDFQESPVWYMRLEDDWVAPIETPESMMDDEPYIALTIFTLKDSTVLNGFCFVYTRSGNYIFKENGKAVPICTSCFSSPEEARKLTKELNRSIDNIFPITYRIGAGTAWSGTIEIKDENLLSQKNSPQDAQ